jgi:hypothetical protein
MRSVSLLAAAVAVGASAVTVACGQQPGTSGTTAASTRSSGAAAGAARAGCHGGVPVAAGHTLTLSNSDSGKSFCMSQGATVLVTLRGTPASMWAPIHASSAALAPRANGRLMLARGVTAAYFAAVHPGTALLTSARPACRSYPPASTQASPPAPPATMRCGVELAFRVSVVIVG